VCLFWSLCWDAVSRCSGPSNSSPSFSSPSFFGPAFLRPCDLVRHFPVLHFPPIGVSLVRHFPVLRFQSPPTWRYVFPKTDSTIFLHNSIKSSLILNKFSEMTCAQYSLWNHKVRKQLCLQQSTSWSELPLHSFICASYPQIMLPYEQLKVNL